MNRISPLEERMPNELRRAARSPFHPGELQVQKRAGATAVAERNGALIADTIMAGALPFLKQQSMLVLGSVSEEGRLWASVLFGPPGFLESEDPKTLRIHLDPGTRDDGDPLWGNIDPGSSIGALAVDLATRRRFRVNGRVVLSRPDLLTVEVEEAYPNCPKYIHRRLLRPENTPPVPNEGVSETGHTVDGSIRDVVETTDTLFVASANPGGSADVSHRGGRPGFVTAVGRETLRIPDYPGNGMFNTFGNLAVNPAAGILIIDFAGRRILQMTGKAHLEWGPTPEPDDGVGTGRSWTFRVSHWVLRPLRAPVNWEFLGFSPHLPGSGASDL